MVKSTNLFRTCNLYFVSQHVFGCWTWNARLLQVARTATKGEGTAVGVEVAIGLKNGVLKIQKKMQNHAKSRLGKINSKPTSFFNKPLDALTGWLSLFQALRHGWAKALDIATPWRCRRCLESPGRLRRGPFLAENSANREMLLMMRCLYKSLHNITYHWYYDLSWG